MSQKDLRRRMKPVIQRCLKRTLKLNPEMMCLVETLPAVSIDTTQRRL